MNEPMTAQHHAIYNAVYDNDGFLAITAYFHTYMGSDTANRAANLLIDAAQERAKYAPDIPDVVMWRQAEVALRRLVWDEMNQLPAWIEVMGFIRTYLMRFSRAAYHAARHSFTVTANDYAAVHFGMRGTFFMQLIGLCRITLDGVGIDVQLMKRSLLGRQRWIRDEIVFKQAGMYSVQGKFIRNVEYSELIWPDGVSIQVD